MAKTTISVTIDANVYSAAKIKFEGRVSTLVNSYLKELVMEELTEEVDYDLKKIKARMEEIELERAKLEVKKKELLEKARRKQARTIQVKVRK